MKAKQNKLKVVSVRFSETEIAVLRQVSKRYKRTLSRLIHDLTIDNIPGEIINLMIENE